MDALWAWLPSVLTLAVGIAVIAGVLKALRARGPAAEGALLPSLVALTLAGVLAIIVLLLLPIGEAARGHLFSLLGLLVTAAVALSSSTLLGNAVAGLMLRSLRHIRAGDFIQVEGHRGRVSAMGLLRTEIQTERRSLTTLPNAWLVGRPVTVVRSSGTFVAATVSLGYDVARARVEACLLRAAEQAELSEPFVRLLELGDFSITYEAAGFLAETRYLISVESRLRACMVDALHEAGIEIVSPTFMNQRQVPPDRRFIPRPERATTPAAEAPEAPPEEHIFDKAEQAETRAQLEEALTRATEALEALHKAPPEDPEELARRVAALEAQQGALKASLSALEAAESAQPG